MAIEALGYRASKIPISSDSFVRSVFYFALLRVLRGSVVNWKLELVPKNAPQNFA